MVLHTGIVSRLGRLDPGCPPSGGTVVREACSRDRPPWHTAPIQVGKRWEVERTNSWLNDFGGLRRCTERRRACVAAYLARAAAIVTVRALRRAAWYLYSWDTQVMSWEMPSITSAMTQKSGGSFIPY